MGNRTKFRSEWRFCVVDAVEQPGWSGLAKLVGVVAKAIGSRSTEPLDICYYAQTDFEIEANYLIV